uniref:tryptophan halogenase family protein n=1 Tax=Alteromonas sp. C1M14 TaxID=2841567 RepID=UPI001C0A6517|nr:tryptophan halogenase family protein [Alteromonas sp. C1M14]MBU2979582.1 tryptophan 7-halogenase [Alteromonas sp. C1M14]
MTAKNNDDTIHSIVIVGGGAAGWLTAAIIAAEHNLPNNPALNVTLVESPDVKILGVGEGTWPTMRDTLRKIGIDETTFLLACDGSFKQGTRFINWRTEATDSTVQDVFDHPFGLPAGFFDTDMAAWWLLNQEANPLNNGEFSTLVSTQTSLCDHFKAPKQLQTPAYAAVANYGYHLNAHKFAELLKNHSINSLGVTHTLAHIEKVQVDSNDNIIALESTAKNGESSLIKGDLFIDCSGFAAKLIQGHYQQAITPVSSGLKNDSAIAVQANYAHEQGPIASATYSTAHSHGWLWDIGLPSRKGVGCVYSSQYCDEDTAICTLLNYLDKDPSTAPVDTAALRKITFTPGYRKQPWVNNCVAIGTSAGFVEPLEASALVMVELSAKYVAEYLPATKTLARQMAKHFNSSFSQRWQRIIDFLKLHYVLSERTDTEYWRVMRDQATASEQLNDWLAQWQHRPVAIGDFIYAQELFPAASYMYILYGMQRQPKTALNKARYTSEKLNAAQLAVKQNQQRTLQQLSALPTNREYINAMRHRAGL